MLQARICVEQLRQALRLVGQALVVPLDEAVRGVVEAGWRACKHRAPAFDWCCTHDEPTVMAWGGSAAMALLKRRGTANRCGDLMGQV